MKKTIVCVLCLIDVPAWLKSLRLHKYATLFSTMNYDDMMSLTEEQLEAQVCVHIDGFNFWSVLVKKLQSWCIYHSVHYQINMNIILTTVV